PFDLVDSSGESAGAKVAAVGANGLSDIFANRVFGDGHAVKFLYFQASTGWKRAPEDFQIPVLRGGNGNPSYVFVGDFTGDGRADIAFPQNPRKSLGQLFMATDDGFNEQPNSLPPVAFAHKNQQDQGVRLVDLNGDGLPDPLVSREGGGE